MWERFEKSRGGLKTIADIGAYLHEIRLAEPRFTGRAIKNITDAIKCAPWMSTCRRLVRKAETFLHKDYDAKKAMIEELRHRFTLDMVQQEINRYADSEFRYADKSGRRRRHRHHPPRAPARTRDTGDRGDEDGGAMELIYEDLRII